MICILRVNTQKSELLKLRKAVIIRPYRVDKDIRGLPEAAYLHYGVVKEDLYFSNGLQNIIFFLEKNANDIAFLSDLVGSELSIDIGIDIFQNEYSKNLDFNFEFMKILVKYKISVTLSLYQTSQSDAVED